MSFTTNPFERTLKSRPLGTHSKRTMKHKLRRLKEDRRSYEPRRHGKIVATMPDESLQYQATIVWGGFGGNI